MMPVLRLRRAIAAGVLAMSALSTVLVPLADARAEAAAATATSHVEATGSSDCTLAHDHSTCQLCRVLRLAGHASQAPLLPALIRAIALPEAAPRDHRGRGHRTANAASRAPPASPTA